LGFAKHINIGISSGLFYKNFCSVTEHNNTNQFLEAALNYANIGWAIFPLIPKQKVPLTEHGVKDATTNYDQIRAWWAKWPNANIGLACGGKSGVYAIDVDVSSDGTINGIESLKEFPPLPETIKQLTMRGGFHALYRTDKAPANRNGFRAGIDIRSDGYYIVLAPSIHPAGRSYMWCDGFAPGQICLAEFPDFMRPVMRAPWAQNEVSPTSLYISKNSTAPYSPPQLRTSNITNDETLRRASLYLAQCDPAIQGCAGHDKMLWAATAMVHGFQLSDSQVYDLLIREYNPRCIPPWDLSIQKDEKDFRRKITEARKLIPQHRPGWLLQETQIEPSCKIDIKSLINASHSEGLGWQAKTIYKKELWKDTTELDFLCQPTGLLGEICSWLNSTSMKEQPFLSLACTLAFLGALFGRKVKDVLGSRTNLYCMGVASSSAGKAHAMNQIRRLGMESGALLILGGDDIASDSAIEERMSRVESTLFLWDEIGHLLTHIKSGASRHLAQVVSLLMKLYSAAGSSYCGKEYAEQGKQRTIIQPCCCIYGTSTSERFTSGITQDELQDGWLSRCLVFYSPDNPIKSRGRIETEIPKEIIDKVHDWYFRKIEPENDGHSLDRYVSNSYAKPAPQQIIVPTDNEAEKIFIEFDNETIKYGKEQPQLACLWAKGEENARRIALIVAAGESYDDPHISNSIAEYATRLIRYILLDFERIIVPEIVVGRIDSDKRKLVAIISKAGKEGCTKTQLTRGTQWATQGDRNKLLADLIEAEEVMQQLGTDNRLRFWTVEHFLKLEKK
jgi:hypothetical protein